MLGLCPDNIRLRHLQHFDLTGIDLLISLSGYTGEDGFETALQADVASEFRDTCLFPGLVTPAGLDASNTLRMEAGLSPWEREHNKTITPIEAGLGFPISKKRRNMSYFPGA